MSFGQRLLIVFLDFVVNFLAMHRHFGRGRDAEFHHVAVHAHYRDVNPPVNHDAFAQFSRQDEHGENLYGGGDR